MEGPAPGDGGSALPTQTELANIGLARARLRSRALVFEATAAFVRVIAADQGSGKRGGPLLEAATFLKKL